MQRVLFLYRFWWSEKITLLHAYIFRYIKYIYAKLNVCMFDGLTCYILGMIWYAMIKFAT